MSISSMRPSSALRSIARSIVAFMSSHRWQPGREYIVSAIIAVHPACAPGRPALRRLLRRDDEVAAAVLRPAALVFVGAGRLLLPLADRREPRLRHAEADQVVLDRAGAA